MTSSDGPVTVDEWRQQLAATRAAAPIVAALPSESRWGLLQQQFRELTTRIRTIHHTQWMQQAGSGLLAQRWRECLEFSQLLAAEFQSRPPAPTRLVQQLLDNTVARVRLVERQLTLCDLAHDVAEQLDPLCQRVVQGTESSARRLLHLAEELVSSLSACRLSPAFLPLDCRLIPTSLAQSGLANAESLSQAILTARLCGELTATVAASDQDQIRIVTAAAFLQDVGLRHDPYERSRRLLSRNRANVVRHSNPNHPGIGAGLLSQLAGCPTALAILVGQHHERLDGSGFPQRLTTARLTRDSQWLAVVVRLVELISDPLTLDLSVTSGETTELLAGLRLWREVRRGSVSEPLAAGLLNSLRPGLAEIVAELSLQRQQRMVDARHGLSGPKAPLTVAEDFQLTGHPGLRADAGGADHFPDAPVYLRRQRGRDSRPVFIRQSAPPLARPVARVNSTGETGEP